MIEAALWAIALAATAGLRVFMPFVFLGGMARYANMPTPGMLDWTATDAGFFFLVVATLLEVLSDKIPVVDHALDSVATLIKPVAGFVLPAALLDDSSPMAAWAAGAIVGAPLAFGVHATKAGTRAVSSATTIGTANPIISTIEDVLAGVILLLVALAPVLAVILVVVLVVFVVRSFKRIFRRRQAVA